VKQAEIVGDDRSSPPNGLGLSERPVSIKDGVDRGHVMGQQSVRQAARRSALDAQAAMRKERADRERRLEASAVAVLTALGERDALVRDAERRAGQALRRMTNDEGLSLREAVEWCGSGVTVRENPVAAARGQSSARSRRTSRMSGRPGWAGRDFA
jgi:hypothetical protein